MDRTKYQYEGMKWIMEHQLLDDPQAINTIRFNILMVSKQIKEVELLIYRENKTMLVLLELSWIARTFSSKRKQIFIETHEILTKLLPSFRFRIIDDPKIMEMSVALVKKALTGGSREKVINPSAAPSEHAIAKPEVGTTNQAATGSPEGLQPSNEEQSQAGNVVRSESGPDDSKKE